MSNVVGCMKKILAATFSLVLLTVWSGHYQAADAIVGHQSELKINFVISEPCSLLAFLDALSQRRHTTSWICEWYWKRRNAASRDQDRAMLASYKSVMEPEASAGTFADESGRDLDLNQKILSLAAECKNLDDLLQAVKSVLNDSDLLKLKAALQYFDPIYQELVWRPKLPLLQGQLEDYRNQAVHCKMAECLTAVKHFMNAPWPESRPFVVVLLPLPAGGKGTHGESMGRVQLVELLPDSPFRKHADVVFHEACHALWFSKKDLHAADKLFVTADGRQLPVTELYEGMATALGQGCFSVEAFGVTPPSWYADATINRYAHEVFPLYADYLNREKQIDAEFGRKAAERYFKLFPDNDSAIKETEAYFVLADKVSDLQKFKAEIYRAMPRLREMSICAPVDASESLTGFRGYRQSGGGHLAVLTSGDNLYKLVELDLTMEQIDFLGRKPGAVTLAVRNKPILFCVAPTEAAQQKLFFDSLKRSKWPSPVSFQAGQ